MRISDWSSDVCSSDLNWKLPAVDAFARANRLDRVVIDSPTPRLVVVTTGKSYLDVRQALDDLGVDDALARDIGLRVYKVGMTWPLEGEGARAACVGAERVLVVEEKRSLIEWQLKDQLYDLPGIGSASCRERVCHYG